MVCLTTSSAVDASGILRSLCVVHDVDHNLVPPSQALAYRARNTTGNVKLLRVIPDPLELVLKGQPQRVAICGVGHPRLHLQELSVRMKGPLKLLDRKVLNHLRLARASRAC